MGYWSPGKLSFSIMFKLNNFVSKYFFFQFLMNRILILQQPVTEGYQYSQLSPSRSPSGPTYTQLSSGARTPATQYHAVTTVPNNPGNIF